MELCQSSNSQSQMILRNVDSYIFLQIIECLDLNEIENLYQSKPSLFDRSDVKIWEYLVLNRGLHYFLATQPLFNYDQQTQEYMNNCNLNPIQEQIVDITFNSQQSLEEHFLPLIIDTQMLKEKMQEKQNWREIFYKYHRKIVFKGNYIGDYDSHGNETLHAIQLGYLVFFVKITGDPNIPAGKITFFMNLTSDLKQGLGQIQLADTGYVAPRWGKAAIKIKNPKNQMENEQICSQDSNVQKQIKVDWFIKNEIIVTFTQRLRFAVWKDNHQFAIKSKQKILNVKFGDFNFSRNFTFRLNTNNNQFLHEFE